MNNKEFFLKQTDKAIAKYTRMPNFSELQKEFDPEYCGVCTIFKRRSGCEPCILAAKDSEKGCVINFPMHKNLIELYKTGLTLSCAEERGRAYELWKSEFLEAWHAMAEMYKKIKDILFGIDGERFTSKGFKYFPEIIEAIK